MTSSTGVQSHFPYISKPQQNSEHHMILKLIDISNVEAIVASDTLISVMMVFSSNQECLKPKLSIEVDLSPFFLGLGEGGCQDTFNYLILLYS